jgi:ABC-2 type transport system permease protein
MWRKVRVYATIFRICVEERLVYRGDFMLSTLFRFLPIVTQIFLWGAIYAVGTEHAKGEIVGYTYGNMVTYYLLTMVARAFSSMPGLASGIAYDVREGNIKKYITQPIDMLGYLLWHRIAHKLVYYAIAFVPFFIVFYLCREFLPGWPDAWRMGAFCLSLVMAFLIGFLLESLIGLISFWFLEVSSLLFIYMMINYFLSGHMIPLEVLRSVENPVAQVVLTIGIDYMPFRFLAYTPTAIFLEKLPTQAAVIRELTIALGWVVALFVANRIAFRRGLKRYGAYGG